MPYSSALRKLFFQKVIHYFYFYLSFMIKNTVFTKQSVQKRKAPLPFPQTNLLPFLLFSQGEALRVNKGAIIFGLVTYFCLAEGLGITQWNMVL